MLTERDSNDTKIEIQAKNPWLMHRQMRSNYKDVGVLRGRRGRLEPENFRALSTLWIAQRRRALFLDDEVTGRPDATISLMMALPFNRAMTFGSAFTTASKSIPAGVDLRHDPVTKLAVDLDDVSGSSILRPFRIEAGRAHIDLAEPRDSNPRYAFSNV